MVAALAARIEGLPIAVKPAASTSGVTIAKAVDEAGGNQDAGHRLLGPLTSTGLKPHFLDKMASNGVNLPPNFFQEEGGERTASTSGIFGRAVGE